MGGGGGGVEGAFLVMSGLSQVYHNLNFILWSSHREMSPRLMQYM